jgi:hypothetical protein
MSDEMRRIRTSVMLLKEAHRGGLPCRRSIRESLLSASSLRCARAKVVTIARSSDGR